MRIDVVTLFPEMIEHAASFGDYVIRVADGRISR